MRETTIAASDAKARFLHVIDEVAKSGNSVLVTKRGQPIVRVVPLKPKHTPLMGSWRNIARIKGDLVSFNTADDWTFDEHNFSPKRAAKRGRRK